MRKIAKILSVSQHISQKDGKVYYKAEIEDDKGDVSQGYLIGEGDELEVFHHDKFDQTKFIIKRPKA